MVKMLCTLSLVGVIFVAGCGSRGTDGRDGQDGRIFIAYSWAYGPFYYSTTDPGVPSYVVNSYYYETLPGTYNYIYESWDGSIWTGTYTVSANPGTPGTQGERGGMFNHGVDGVDGRDGDDNYYNLTCYSSGTNLFRTSTFSLNSMSKDSKFQERLLAEIAVNGKEPLPLAERNKMQGQKLK